MTPAEHSFENPADLAAALAREIAGRLTAAVAARGVASLIATGGSTPGPVYDALSATPAPWDRVVVSLSDERWVAADDPASNERLLRERLLVGRAAAARLVPLKTAAATPAEAAPEVGRALADLPRPFDVTLLGMGEDGHVASLFPHAPDLIRAMDLDDPALARAIESPGAAGSPHRLSLTRKALLDSRWIAILVQGKVKHAVFRRALEDGPIEDLPVRGLLRQTNTPVELWWTP